MFSILPKAYEIKPCVITCNNKGGSSPPPSTIEEAYELNVRGLFCF